jgi:hypothetical protein
MTKNLSREFATMSDDERRRFALQEGEGTDDQPAELEFENPRNEEHMGQQPHKLSVEDADSTRSEGESDEDAR